MSADIWVYEPYDHKNKWRGHDRKIPLGPRAQALLGSRLNREPTAYMLSPDEAEQWRHAQRRKRRHHPPCERIFQFIPQFIPKKRPIGGNRG
ncbi:MAG TPA: hypothetical protein VE890_13550 [Thermoguttaceae bacterium]|nr:hypothetical protein [Thermoguttaceae bacterium]